jgi:hypothetical protein
MAFDCVLTGRWAGQVSILTFCTDWKWRVLRQADEACKNRIALAPGFAHYPPILARALSAAVGGVEAFPVEVEGNSGFRGHMPNR